MNKVITAAVILCLAGAANAGDARTSHNRSQVASSAHQILIGVDVESALPLSSAYSDLNGPGAGALLTIEYPMMEQLSLTGRVGFQFHFDKSPVAGIDSHVHAIPVLLGAKYYIMQQDRQGLFAAAEIGTFGLMASVSNGTTSASDTQLKVGMGAGVGYAWDKWNVRLNIHAQDVGNFGDFVMVSGGVGYQFAGL
jgi:Outer membrane protein beta-barrel domain